MKKEEKVSKKKVKVNTFSKVIVVAVMLHGFILSTMSYVLSYLGRDTVYEVSTVLVTEILAPVVTYLATNTIANIFEKNKLSFSVPLTHEYMMNKESKSEYKDDQSSEDSCVNSEYDLNSDFSDNFDLPVAE